MKSRGGTRKSTQHLYCISYREQLVYFLCIEFLYYLDEGGDDRLNDELVIPEALSTHHSTQQINEEYQGRSLNISNVSYQ